MFMETTYSWDFLNQVCAGHRLVHTWFLKLFLWKCLYAYVFVSLCVSVYPQAIIASGMMWYDVDYI